MTTEQSSNGQNDSERYLAKLCRRAFLSLWSYPNLYTNEGKKTPNADGKELCDLCVVFGNDIILFSDKVAEFGHHEDLLINWSRWYRRAIKKSACQLYGAEHWIRHYPDRIFIDKKCTTPFPIPIPDLNTARFHLVAVTRGSYDACFAFHGAQSIGSLKINTGVIGPEHESNPFNIGIVDENKSFVHIFDEFTLEVVLRELDTISDFLSYLTVREEFLSNDARVILAAGEEQIVAKYLTTVDEHGKHFIFLPGELPDDFDCINLTEGFWEDLINNPEYKKRQINFEDSYLWDRLIERFISVGDPKHIGLDWVMDENPPAQNDALLIMASEPRWMRMELIKQFRDVIAKAQPKKRNARVFSVKQHSDTAYIFIVYPNPSNIPYEDYRKERATCLFAYCMSAKLIMPNALQAVGIAIDYPTEKGVSEDLSYVDFRDWNDAREAEAKSICREFEILRPETISWHFTKGNTWGVMPNSEQKNRTKSHEEI